MLRAPTARETDLQGLGANFHVRATELRWRRVDVANVAAEVGCQIHDFQGLSGLVACQLAPDQQGMGDELGEDSREQAAVGKKRAVKSATSADRISHIGHVVTRCPTGHFSEDRRRELRGG